MGRALAPAAVVIYALLSLRQLTTLSPASLEFDFHQFQQAAQDLAAGRDPYSVYLACCAGSKVAILRGYIYPPLLAWLLRPIAGLSETHAAVAWYLFLQVCLGAAIWIAYRALRPSVSRDALSWLLAGTLLFPPLLENLGFMQVGTPVMLLLVLAGAAFLRPATTALSGVAVAVGTALRVSPGLVGLALVRRERQSLQGIAVAGVTGLLLLGLMVLTTPWLGEYVRRVLPALAGGSAVFDNQAPAGIALRARLFVFGGGAPALGVVGPLVSLLVVGFTLVRSLRRAALPPRRAAVFAAWVAATPLVSSITWTHHLATEMVALAFLAPSLAPFARAWWLAVLAYPMLWIHRVLQVVLVMAGVHSGQDIGGVGLVLLSSVPAVGMLLLWTACLEALKTPEGPDGTV